MDPIRCALTLAIVPVLVMIGGLMYARLFNGVTFNFIQWLPSLLMYVYPLHVIILSTALRHQEPSYFLWFGFLAGMIQVFFGRFHLNLAGNYWYPHNKDYALFIAPISWALIYYGISGLPAVIPMCQ